MRYSNNTTKKIGMMLTMLLSAAMALNAQDADSGEKTKKTFIDRWSITGYVEIAAQRNFDKLGGRSSNPLPDFPTWTLNLPKSSIWAEFDCGKGWTVGTQVEFTNGGTVPMRGIGNADSRPMDWDQDLSLSELWIQKSFSDAANLKIGLIGTPDGRQNDMPTQYFGVIRPEDGPAYLALNNQSPAIDFNGESGDWIYDVMVIPGFVNYDFGNEYWLHGSGDDAYTQTIDRLYAGAFRVDNISVPGLKIGISGEIGGGRTWLEYGQEDQMRRQLKSVVTLASLDWEYDDNNIIFRGEYQYGYVSNKDKNPGMRNEYGAIRDMQAMSLGAELGYDFFSLNEKLSGKQKFYLFGRYDWREYQNHEPEPSGDCRWVNGQRFSLGINWFPIKNIIVKGEWGFGFDNDPARTFGGASIAYQF